MIYIKNEKEIETMRAGGKILAHILKQTLDKVVAGVGTADLDEFAENEIRSAGGFPMFKGYLGFPTALCTSLNNEVVHGPAKPNRILKEGDILSIDVGMRYPAKKGLITDMAFTVVVGSSSPQIDKLLQTTQSALDIAIQTAHAGVHLGDVCHAIEEVIFKAGYSYAQGLVGHGVGEKLHEDPQVPNFGRPGTGPLLEAGMTLAIEPMVCMGRGETFEADNGAMVTLDGSLSAHFEHTILITEGKAEILTSFE